MINSRTRTKPRGCPYCSGRRAIKGETDLKTTHPHLVDEWDFKLNTVKPEDVSHSSDREVYWKCSKGHGWRSRISNRAIYNNGCPTCANKLRVESRKKTIEKKKRVEGLSY